MRARALTGAVFLLSTLALPVGAGVATERNLVRRTLEHGGIERTYHVHYPNRQRPVAPLPDGSEVIWDFFARHALTP
jgi:hypothetical protein